ncbi:MAG: hypothetical protein SWO11_10810 [Thermodesulfobacteriota bacterium]|nr:hypothetical protein [Thermodesulfobacteriota bacterium]
MIGSSEIFAVKDCCIYLLDLNELVLIDTGAGESFSTLIENIKGIGLNPELISTINTAISIMLGLLPLSLRSTIAR